jgi:chemotaxis protein MotC
MKLFRHIILFCGAITLFGSACVALFFYRDKIRQEVSRFISDEVRLTVNSEQLAVSEHVMTKLPNKQRLHQSTVANPEAYEADTIPILRGTAISTNTNIQSEHQLFSNDDASVDQTSYRPPASSKSELVRQLRVLQSIQSRLAYGDKSVLGGQRGILLALETELLKQSIDTRNPFEVDAIAVYLLSGGQPGPIQDVLKKARMSKKQRTLIQGSIAYVKGDSSEASALLAPLNPKIFPAFLAGHLAMVQSSFTGSLTPSERRSKLNFVINLLHGTLMEEAALRRLVKLSADSLDAHSFLKASDRYIRHFPRSLYGNEFISDLLSGLIRFEVQNKPIKFYELDRVLVKLDATRRRKFLENLARIAISKGLRGLCQSAAGRARRIASEGSPDSTRATLYYRACGVVDQSEAVIGNLESLDTSSLSNSDQLLHQMAKHFASQLHSRKALTLAGASMQRTPEVLPDDMIKLKASVAQQLHAIKELMERANQ